MTERLFDPEDYPGAVVRPPPRKRLDVRDPRCAQVHRYDEPCVLDVNNPIRRCKYCKRVM